MGTDSSTRLRLAQNDSKSTMVAATVVPLRHPERSAKHEAEGSVPFLSGGVQHGLDEDAVAPGGVVDQDVGDGAYQFPILDDGAAGHE